MSLPRLSIDELIATIKRSNLPTILVEGKSDASIYRWIEESIGTFNGNIIPCGGKDVVFELYRRRNEFKESKVLFLADKDMWLFTALPGEYDDIIWTNGYSIENDLFSGGYSIERLFDKDEKKEFDKTLKSISKWFAFEVEKFIKGEQPQFYHPSQMLGINLELREEFLESISYSEPNADLVEDIQKNYKVKLRGKTLLELYAYMLSNPRRKPKYGKDNVIDLCLRNGVEKSKLNDIVSLIKIRLSNWYISKGAAVSRA